MTDKVQCDTPFIAVVSVVSEEINVLEKVISKAFTTADNLEHSSQKLLTIACKYYTADVIVKCTSDREEAKTAEAVVIYFDGQESTSWQEAVDWMKLTHTWAVPLRLLVCSSITESRPLSERRFYTTVVRAALDVQFELVELDPSEDSVEPDDECGAARIKSAIEAHVWPNMKSLKHEVRACQQRKPQPTDAPERGKDAKSPDSRSQTDSQSADATGGKEERSPGDAAGRRNQPSSSEETRWTEFEKAFSSLMTIRKQVANCSDKDKRHRLAEKLTVKFWRAIGGPDDETEGLGSPGGSSDDEGPKGGGEKSEPVASKVGTAG